MHSCNPLRVVLLTCCIQFASFFCTAQTSHDPLPDNQQFSIGFSAGISDLWGDIGTTYFWNHYRSPNYWEDLHFMGSIQTRYSIKSWIAVRASVGYGSIYASDKFNKFLADRDPDPKKLHYQLYIRNLDVKSNIVEGNLVFELNPFRALSLAKPLARMRIQPILLLGIGYFHFSPHGTYYALDGSQHTVHLRSLRTEGQGLRGSRNGMYSLNQLNMPIGGGLRYQVSDRVTVGLEYQYRLCFTDYLDDVSDKYIDPAIFDNNMSPQEAAIAKSMHNKSVLIDPSYTHPPGDIRGTPKEGDGYSTFGITFFYTFLNKDYVHSYHRNGQWRTTGDRLQ